MSRPTRFELLIPDIRNLVVMRLVRSFSSVDRPSFTSGLPCRTYSESVGKSQTCQKRSIASFHLNQIQITLGQDPRRDGPLLQRTRQAIYARLLRGYRSRPPAGRTQSEGEER
jgi:hypothetical protein